MSVFATTPEQRWQLALLGDMTRHIAGLRKQFGDAGHPLPRAVFGEAYVRTNIPFDLNNAGWQNFAVALKAVERGNNLTATFRFLPVAPHARSLEMARLSNNRLNYVADILRDSPRTDIVEWNLHMVNAAITMMEAVSHARYGVPAHVIESFVAGSTETFRSAFSDHLITAASHQNPRSGYRMA